MSTVVVDDQKGPSTSIPEDRQDNGGQQSAAAAEPVEEVQYRQKVCDENLRKKPPARVTKQPKPFLTRAYYYDQDDEDVYRKALRNNRSKLIDKIDVSVKFLNQLVDVKVITEDQFHRLKEKVGTSQIDALLDILEKQPKHTFPMFLKALSDNGQHHIASMLKSPPLWAAAGNDYVEEPLPDTGGFHAGALFFQGPSPDSTYRSSAISDQSDVTSTTGSISQPAARNGNIAQRVKMLEEALKKQYCDDRSPRRTTTVDGYRPPKSDSGRRPRRTESRRNCAGYAVEFGRNQRSVIRRAVHVEFRGQRDDEYSDGDHEDADFEDDVYLNINTKRIDRKASIGRKRRQAHYPMTCRGDSRRSKRSSVVHQYQPLSSNTDQTDKFDEKLNAGNVPSHFAILMVAELKSFLDERIDCCEQKLDELKELVLQLHAANVTRTSDGDDVDDYAQIATDSSIYDIMSFPTEVEAANELSEGSQVADQPVSSVAQTIASVETICGNFSRNACLKIGASQSVPHFVESKELTAVPGIRGHVCDRKLTTNKTSTSKVPGKIQGAEEHQMTDICSELQNAIKLNQERRQNVTKDQRARNESHKLLPAATNMQPDQLTAVQLEVAALQETNRVKQFVMQQDPSRIQMLWKPATPPAVQLDSVHGSSPVSQQNQMSCNTNQSTLFAVSDMRYQMTDNALGCWDRQGKPTGRTTVEAVQRVQNTSSTTVVVVGKSLPSSVSIQPSCAKSRAVKGQINSAPDCSLSQTVMSSDPDASHRGDAANSGSRPLVWAVTGKTVNTRTSIIPDD